MKEKRRFNKTKKLPLLAKISMSLEYNGKLSDLKLLIPYVRGIQRIRDANIINPIVPPRNEDG